MIFLSCVLFAVAFGGLFFYTVNTVFGETAFVRNRLQERILDLQGQGAVLTVEKITDYSDIETLNRLLKQQSFIQDLNRMIEMAGWKISAGLFILICFLLSAVLYLYLVQATSLQPLPAFGISLAVLVIGPISLLRFKRNAYLNRFTGHFPRAIRLIRNGLEAGLGFNTSFERAAKDSPFPVNVEFQKMIDEMKLGQSFLEGLAQLKKRVPTSDMSTFAIALSVQQQSGGNLSELMRNLEETIYSRLTLRKELKVLTAQARLSGLMIGLLPVAIVIILEVVNPSYINILFQTPLGKKLVETAVVLEIIAALAIKKMVSVRIAT